MLTHLQEGILFHYLQEPKSAQYFEQLSLEISGEINLELFKTAWHTVIQTNEMLRTVFRWEKMEKPTQIILKEHTCDITFYDLTDEATNRQKSRLQEIKDKDKQTPFDLQEVPMRIMLCKLGTHDYEMIISNHHIIYDGWSNGIILKEFFRAYYGLSAGKPALLPDKPSFKEFIKWLQNEDKYEKDKQKAFWRDYLAGLDGQTELPLKNIKNRKNTGSKQVEHYSLVLEPELKERLEAFAKTKRFTLAGVFYTVWGLLLHQYCNSQDVLFGTTVAGRSARIKGIEEMVGLFINTIPLRIQTTPGEKMVAVVSGVDHALQARELFENTPLLDIRNYSGLSGYVSLFDTLVVIENYPLDSRLLPEESGLSVHAFTIAEMTHYDLTVGIVLFNEIAVTFSYNPELFAQEMIAHLAGHFLSLVQMIIENGEQDICAIEIISPEEKHRVLYEFNNTAAEYPSNKTIPQLFMEQSARTPDYIALIWEKSGACHISYAELNELSNRLAYWLQTEGIRPDTIVAIMVNRSIEMIVGLMGILKAGAAYLPINPEYPAERIQFMLQDSTAKIVLTEPIIQATTSHIPIPPIIPIIPIPPITPSNLAYVIYTSGTTGKPKGVLVEHQNAVNVVCWLGRKYQLNPDTHIILMSDYTFDASIDQIFGALLHGASLYIASKEFMLDMDALRHYINKNRINFINFVPLVLNELLGYREKLPSLNTVISGAERLDDTIKDNILKRGYHLYNHYGPTETTVETLVFTCTDAPVYLGKPIANTKIYILDQWEHIVPIGVPGELYIAGAGLARGYLNRSDLTAEKFVATPHGVENDPVSRTYRTGDLGCWLPDGNIAFLGRIDQQVKIRGFRVELGEIEAQLRTFPEIKQVVVSAKEDNRGDKTLCAYIVSRQLSTGPTAPLDPAVLTTYLAGILPDYMIPAYYVQLAEIPLLPNGKVDRKNLPEPVFIATQAYQEPRHELDRRLQTIWTSVLFGNVLSEDSSAPPPKPIGIDDNFFHMGGHSLKIMNMAAKIHKELNLEIPVQELFTHPTIRVLANYINTREHTKNITKNNFAEIAAIEVKEYYPLSSAQKRVYILYLMETDSINYNMHEVFRLEGELDVGRLEKSFTQLIRRHESLRTSFFLLHDEPVQKIVAASDVPFASEFFDPNEKDTLVEPALNDTALMENTTVYDINQRFLRPFDLTQAPLFRVGLIKIAKNSHILMAGMHHIISDGISIDLFITDFVALYRGQNLPPLPIQYKEYAHWQHQKKAQGAFNSQRSYWLHEFAGELPVLTMPYDFPRPAVQSFAGDKYYFNLPAYETKTLIKRCQEEAVTLFMMLSAIYYVMLWKLSGAEEIVVGSPTAGRRHADLESILGMFVNTLAVKTSPAKETRFKPFLAQVKQKNLAAFENQEYQFDDLVEELLPARDLGRNPLFDMMFILQNMTGTTNTAINIPGLKITRLPFETHIAPFDFYLMAEERQESIYFTVGYCTKLFTLETVRRFMGYYREILATVVTQPEVELARIDILSPAEKRQLVQEFNNTQRPYPQGQTIPQWFAEQAARTPEAIAVVGEGVITYRELNQRANQLAHLLRQKGVAPDTIVALFMFRSIQMVVGILGILKAGGAYLPINPVYPGQRVLSILEDSGGNYFISDEKTSRPLSFTGLQRLDVPEVTPLVTAKRPQITNFDSLPHPDRTLIDYSKYHRYIGIAPAKYTVSIQATRGCPYQCAYCHKIWPKTHVMRRAEDIFAEISACYQAGVKRFVFIDDVFNLNKKNSGQLFQTLIDHHYDVQLFFPNGLRGDILTPDFIDLMIEAGTVNIDLALETASPRLQKLINKQLNLEKFAANVHYITQKHPHVVLEMEMMIGFPTETEAEALQTLELLQSFKWVHFPNLNILKIYPNTDMAQLAIENGVSRKLIHSSTTLAFHELPETLPFSKDFVREYQARFTNQYFLSQERLRHVLKQQVKSFTADELVQKYDSYLPVEIKSFADILKCADISSAALGPIEFIPEARFAAPDFNQRIKAFFPSRPSSENAFRLLFLDLSQSFRADMGHTLYDVGAEPLGLMYLASYLQEQLGPHVRVKVLKSRIDFDSYAQLQEQITLFQPHLIGLRTLSLYKDFFHRTVSLLRQWGITAPIIAGGPYATSDYKQMLQDPHIHLAVLGEGEATTLHLVKEMMTKNNTWPADDVLETIPGLAFIRQSERMLTTAPQRQVLLLDQISGPLAHFPTTNPQNVNHPGDLLYLISTSGSTGKPKSVMVEHRTLVNLLHFQFHHTAIHFSRVLQFAAIGFDVSVQEIFSALLAGGTLYLPDEDMKSDVPRLFQFIQQNQIEILFLPPAFLNFVFSDPDYIPLFPDCVRHIIAAGEQLIVNEALRLFLKQRHVYLHNHYGPSETHVVTTLTMDPTQEIPHFPGIGSPVSNTGIYILDSQSNLLPLGVSGELNIGGIQVGRGYLGNVALTAEKFVPNPFVPGDRLYRTGDMARWWSNGSIQFLGRLDFQIKIRGFRIEPGEIEGQLKKHPDIKETIVLALADNKGELYLVAYVVLQPQTTMPLLREFLLNRLPDYMVPAHFIPLARIPLNASGKVDRHALPPPENTPGNGHVAPRDPMEKKLAAIWCTVLGKDVAQDTVSIDDNFFQMGGHSLKATALTSRLAKEFHVKVPLVEIFKEPTIRGLSGYIAHSMVEQYAGITPVEEQEYYPLSSAQKRLHFLQQMDKAGTTYHLTSNWLLEGVVAKNHLEQSLLKLLQRHESLRTSFDIIAEEPVQIIHPKLAFVIEDEHATMDSFLRPFALSHAPLLRVGLVKIAAEKFLLLVDMHHIISDGLSMDILSREFTALLAGVELPPLRLQYKDYAAWQSSEKESPHFRQQELFWQQEFSGAIPVLDLPVDYSRPPVQSFAGASLPFALSRDSVVSLQAIAVEASATMYMVLLTCYTIFLAKMSNQEDIVIGTPIAGRRHADLEKIIGMFVNTLVLRNYPVAEKKFSDFLAEVKERTLKAFENQEYPYEDLVDKVTITRDVCRNPLFDTMFVLQNATPPPVDIPGLKIAPVPQENKTAKFDLTLTAVETPEKIELNFEYCTKLFKKESIHRFITYFTNIIDSVLADPFIVLGQIPLLSPAQREQLLVEINAPAIRYPNFKTIQGLFAEQVKKTPDRPALTGIRYDQAETHLTYRQLDQLSRQLAHQLTGRGLGPNKRAAIMVGRNVEMIIAILGIIQAGAAYVPLDPQAPVERLHYVLADCGAELLLTFRPLAARLAPAIDTLYLEEFTTLPATPPDAVLSGHPDDLAYIIYTSGSTGRPKGVPICHRNVSPLLFWGYRYLGICRLDRVIQSPSYYFDWSVWEIFITLTSGAHLVMISEELVLDPPALVEFIRQHAITTLHITPTQLSYLVNSRRPMLSLHHLCIGAEKLTYDLVARALPLLATDCRIYNMYGPTEATIISAVAEIDREQIPFYLKLPSIPIGHTIANTTLFVLDHSMNPCPIHVVGELYIAGDALARGYLNDPEKTVASFVTNPFAEICGPYLYKTGDRVRRLEDGSILFLGRADDQVKIRGYRIELGEIENWLLHYPHVKDALVLVKADHLQEKYLCAYVACPIELDTAELRDFLAARLPAYMIPAHFITLEHMPLNPNGKVDKKRLPLPEMQTSPQVVAPKNDLEKTILSIWQDVLGLDHVGTTDNYFERGGNSMNIVKVSHRLKSVLNRDIPVMDLFRYPTIKTLAAYLNQSPGHVPFTPSEIGESLLLNQPEIPRHESVSTTPAIAVIGMAGRLPGANTISAFWNNLKHGVESIAFFSPAEFADNGGDPRSVNLPNYVKTRCDLQDIQYFDSSFFGYTPVEAEIIDPQMRLFHECVWEAFEDAGYESGSYAGRIGLYSGGESSSFWETLTSLSQIGQLMNPLILGNLNNKDYLSSRIAYKFNLRGPSVTMNTACSTSLVAIHFAVQGLLNRECEIALAGGVRVMLPGKTGYLYQEGMIQSPDGHCRAFDARANGTVGGDGVGVVVLKTLARAQVDGDHIYAVIKGSAINNDGIGKVGYHAPSINGQAAAIRAACANAAIDPGSIGYIETHGTGTQLGDTVEIEALKLVFNALVLPQHKNTCAIGSVKTNFGHLGSAAGVAGFIKTVLTLKHRLIPPSLHFERPNPKIDFENSPFYVNTQLTPWPSTLLPARASVSSFGIGGTNAHIILEAVAPTSPAFPASARPDQLLLLSARTPAALHTMSVNLLEYLKENPVLSLADVAYTLQVGRKRMAIRRKLVCSTSAQVIDQLAASGPAHVGAYTALVADEDRKVIFMFPGLGAQHVNMGRGLYHTEPIFRDVMDRCFAILKDLYPVDIKEILYPAGEISPASNSQFHSFEVEQLVLFVFEYALARLILSWGIQPHAMIGYSFGEYVAACLAGVFRLQDILKLLVVRGRLISQLPAGAMLSVPLPVEAVQPFLPAELSIAIDNRSSCVVSGPAQAVASFAQQMKAKKLLCPPFESPFAAHSSQLDPILAEFHKEVATISLQTPQIPYISTCTGTWITVADAQSPEYWVKQLRSTVYFVRGIHQIIEGVSPVFLEMGPGRDMSALVNREITAKTGIQTMNLLRHRGSLKERTDEDYLLDKIGRLWLYGVNIDWQAYHSGQRRSRLSLPTYPFEKKRAWKIMENYHAGQYSYLPGAPGAPESSHPAQGTPLAETPGDHWTQEPPHLEWNARPQLSTSYVAPRDEVQQVLLDIWQHFFGIQEIGITDDFFELGGDSLKATTLLSTLHKEANILVPLTYFFDNPTIEKIAAYAITSENDADPGEKEFHAIQLLEQKEYYPLSSAQKRMTFFQQLDQTSIGYNLVLANTIQGNLDTLKLAAIFTKLSARHEILRTSIEEIQGETVQRIHPHIAATLITGHGESPEVFIAQFIRPFDLARAPLMRVGLLSMAEQQYLLIVDMHHIISDGTSLAVLIGEFLALYQEKELPVLLLQYKDYAVWQNQEMAGGLFVSQRDYWIKTFAGEVPVLELPYDCIRPLDRTYAGDLLAFEIDRAETSALNHFASQQGVTLYMVLLCLTTILLAKLSGQETVVVGTPIAGRTHADLGRIIGMFVNTLAMKNEPNGQKTIQEFLKEVKENTLSAFANQNYQYEELVEHLPIDRSLGHNPLFDTLLVLQNMALPNINIPELTLTPYPYHTGLVNFDLTFLCVETPATLSFTLEYSTELFKKETAQRFIGFFKKILTTVLAHPEGKISQIEIISQPEKTQILYDFNNTTVTYPANQTLPQLFSDQAARTPDHIAIIGPTLALTHCQLTYSQLNEASNRLAHWLLSTGVRPNTIVAIMIERSIELIIGIIGILESGAAYLPIDPQYPEERKQYILADSNTTLILTQHSIQQAIPITPITPNTPIIPILPITPINLAYIIYTSGSTGRPKGVMVDHHSIANTLYYRCQEYRIVPSDRVLQLFSFAFDGFLTSCFTPLLSGASVVQLSQEDIKDIFRIKEMIVAQRITHFIAVPSLYRSLLEVATALELSHLKIVTLAGEQVPPDLVVKSKSLNPLLELVNEYGPTESSVLTSIHRNLEPGAIISIGKPIANTRIYILDQDDHVAPIGLPGQLVISGLGLARGYLNNPQLTAATFFSLAHSATFATLSPKLYKSGDLARWLPDGNIEFLGRIDQQVKIRGFRIELGEIENQLLRHPQIKEAVVDVRTENSGDHYLCAYIVTQGEWDISQAREYLAKTLPDYMIPAHFVALEKIPLSPTGKILRSALPQPQLKSAAQYVPPRNDIEQQLVEIWTEILGSDPLFASFLHPSIGIDDNFFHLGGHSLKAMTMVTKLHKALNVKVPLVEVFKTLTIRKLAAYILGLKKELYTAIQPAETREYYDLSSAQRRFYILQQMELDSFAYNNFSVMVLDGLFDKEKFGHALNQLIARHDSLRTSFELIGGEPFQKIHQQVVAEIAYFDFTPPGKSQLLESTIQHFNRPFDLSHAPLLRFGIILVEQQKSLLLLSLHHIISDGTSIGTFMNELIYLYLGRELPPLRLQYHDFSQWQKNLLVSGALKTQEEYWLKVFAGELPVLEMPTDYPRPAVQSFAGHSIDFFLEEDVARQLETLVKETGTTLYILLLALYSILLSKFTGQKDIIIGSPIAGRNHADLEGLIGLFIETIVIRCFPLGDKPFLEFLAEVKSNTFNAYENQGYPFGELLKHVGTQQWDGSRNPLFDAMLIVQNVTQDFKVMLLEDVKISPYVASDHRVSKMDITLEVIEAPGRIHCNLEYCTALFTHETMAAFIASFQKIVAIVLENNNIRLQDIQLSHELKGATASIYDDAEIEF